MEPFRAYEVQAEGVPAYFIESTAPISLDQAVTGEPPTPDYCFRLPSADAAIEKIVNKLSQFTEPKLVIMVHGYNSPREKILKSYTNAFLAVNNDPQILDEGVVCIGYRWPSELMAAPWTSALSSTPLLLIGLLTLAIFISFVGFVTDVFGLHVPVVLRVYVTMIVAFMGVVPITLMLLRLSVYYRDGYRATTYGVPDLVEIIRKIDSKLSKELEKRKSSKSNFVGLSLIGHSMGGYVVTNTLHLLSNVLSLDSVRAGLDAGVSEETSEKQEEKHKIGKVFRLMQLVLVSPDIPALALLSNRANFVTTSLVCFEESYLFSNEGDVVLRIISTVANFFSLPTQRSSFGYRLGNVGVLTGCYGITPDVDISKLRVGNLTFEALCNLNPQQFQDVLPKRLSYFDCTDSIEVDGQGVVTDAQRGVPYSRKHLRLLALSMFSGRPDVHSGYFESKAIRAMIYRLACLGYAATDRAYTPAGGLHGDCQAHQVKAMRGGSHQN